MAAVGEPDECDDFLYVTVMLAVSVLGKFYFFELKMNKNCYEFWNLSFSWGHSDF